MFDLSAMMIGVDGFIVFLFASDHDVEDCGEFLAYCYHGLQMTSFCTHVTEVVAESAFGAHSPSRMAPRPSGALDFILSTSTGLSTGLSKELR